MSVAWSSGRPRTTCATWVPSGCHLGTTWVPPGCHLGSTWAPPGHHLCTTWPPLGYHLCATWVPPGYHLCTTWAPPGSNRAPPRVPADASHQMPPAATLIVIRLCSASERMCLTSITALPSQSLSGHLRPLPSATRGRWSLGRAEPGRGLGGDLSDF